MKLFNFQKKAIKDLLKLSFFDNDRNIVFKAPTGSGKTIMMEYFIKLIEDILYYGNSSTMLKNILHQEDDSLLKYNFEFLRNKYGQNGKKTLEFIWLSPSVGNLANQSKVSMEKNFHIKANNLNDFMKNNRYNNIVTFIGFSSINNINNVVNKESETKNIDDIIKEKHLNGVDFIVVIDEAHLNDTDKTKTILEKINPILTIEMTATPNKKANVVVDEQDVIDEGLITKNVYINKNLKFSNYNMEDDFYKVLIDNAIKQYHKIKNEYDKKYNNGFCKIKVNPLIVIQYPNNNDDFYEQVNDYILSKGYLTTQIAKWLTIGQKEIKENLENIEDSSSEVVFLNMKQAIATGWDCPRAKILVKLRATSKESFETQIVGRFRRMPEKHHYDNTLLDNAFVYTNDEKWTKKCEDEELVTMTQEITLKESVQLPNIYKEIRNRDTNAIGEEEIRKIIQNHYETNVDIKTYVINKMFKSHYIEGSIYNLDINDKYSYVNEKSITYKNTIEEISQKTKLNDSCMTRNILKTLFLKKNKYDKSLDKKGYVLELDSSLFPVFICNNKGKIIEDFRNALQDINNQSVARKKHNDNFQKEIYELPKAYEIKLNRKITRIQPFKKNAYENIFTNIKCSKPEQVFQTFIDSLENTNWWIKNGDVGEDFLSIVYFTIIEKQYQFYPDYICKINNEIWIIETKGGESINGENENIDAQASNKFYALKDWAKENNVHFGFVRYSELENQLYMSTTDYVEKLQKDESSPWKPIENVLII